MRAWFTRPGADLAQGHIKRFDPLHWSVDFPRGTIACVRRGDDAHSLKVSAEFLRTGDLVGLIWDSEDRHAHPAHALETKRDYAGTRLSFRWQSNGLATLDATHGPTLTIEGRDGTGAARTWYVKLWDYADGSSTDAIVSLDFDAMSGTSLEEPGAVQVDPGDIDRMFISLVPPDFAPGGTTLRSAPAAASVTMSDIVCAGPGSVIQIADTWQPQNGFGIATGYDDQYHLPPERVIEAIERLGYDGVINHYVGMSHYMALGGDGKLVPTLGLNGPARDWQVAFAKAAAAAGREVIWSLSYEIFDEFCPDAWKQRAFDGTPAQTGWVPPSTLVSPANSDAIDYLESIAAELVGIAEAAGLKARFQVGEPWWWTMPDGRPCLYNDAAKAAFGGSPVEIASMAGPKSAAEEQLLDDAGALLAASTASVASAAKAAGTNVQTLLLAYLPTVLDPQTPEAKRANLPVGWAKPAFDVLQLEDYDWVTDGRPRAFRDAAAAAVEARLGYPVDEQHYLSGFAYDTGNPRPQWRRIVDAAGEGRDRGVAETIVWALPQVLRDGIVIMNEEEDPMDAFAEVDFPIGIGAQASASPTMSTQIVTSASGHEYRNANWQGARLRFDAGPGVRSEDELETLIAFFRARRGPAQAFRFRDPFDHSSNAMTGTPEPTDQLIGTGDGAASLFALVKQYGEGEERRIAKPAAGSVRVAIDGVEQATGWTLDDAGRVSFDTPPASGTSITAGFLFDVPVRFAEDRIEVNRASFLAGDMPSVPLVEVREASE